MPDPGDYMDYQRVNEQNLAAAQDRMQRDLDRAMAGRSPGFLRRQAWFKIFMLVLLFAMVVVFFNT